MHHIDNSAGIGHFPEWQSDTYRLGLGLYGIDPQNSRVISHVSTLRATILQMCTVKTGDTVGYSRRGEIRRDSMIAVIPIGYADGLNRRLGNQHGYCLVNRQHTCYVGNVCMDVAMIDVTGVGCKEGDQVGIFGDHSLMAVLSNTFETTLYEVLVRVSGRVKRVYYQD